MIDGFFGNEGAVLAADFDQDFAFVEKAFADGEQIAALVEELPGLEMLGIGQDLLFGAVDIFFEGFDCGEFVVHNLIEDDMHQECRPLAGILNILLDHSLAVF